MMALAATPPSARTAATPMRNSTGTYGSVIAPPPTAPSVHPLLRARPRSCRRAHPGEPRDDPVNPVTAVRLVAVGQQLEHEPHHDRPRQPLPHAHPHHRG